MLATFVMGVSLQVSTDESLMIRNHGWRNLEDSRNRNLITSRCLLSLHDVRLLPVKSESRIAIDYIYIYK